MNDVQWALLVAAVATVVLTLLQRRHLAAVRADRAALFEDAGGLLAGASVQSRGLDFPVLRGTYEGLPVRVEPVVDTIGFRVVPVLRLVISLSCPAPDQPRLSILRDETGQEFYAGHRGLARLRWPEFPGHLSVACADPHVAPGQVRAAVAAVTDRAEVKQLLLTASGVRCVIRAGQSDSATYRVTRRVDLSGARVSRSVLLGGLQTALEAAAAVGRDAASRAQVAQ